MAEIPKWKTSCESLAVPESIPDLEDAISQHQSLIESITQAYSDVSISQVYSDLSITQAVLPRPTQM